MSNLDKVLYAIVALCVITGITVSIFLENELKKGRELLEYSQEQSQAYEAYKALKEVNK